MKGLKKMLLILTAAVMTACVTFSLAACHLSRSSGVQSNNNATSEGSFEAVSAGESVGGVSAGDSVTSASEGVTSASEGATSASTGATSASAQSGDGSATPSASSIVSGNDILKSYAALSESACFVWNDLKASFAKVFYKKSGASSYTAVDNQLIRQLNSAEARVDVLGLAAGNYDFKIEVGENGKQILVEKVAITAYDRSGYAHFNYNSGVGAYNDDGTLKSNAIVVYVTEETKNTVKANGKTGITAIMQSATSTPIAVRLIGRVSSDTRTSATTYEGKYELINGLRDQPNSGDGTLWGQMSVENVKNITLEGVGDDAEIYQWGITFKRANSIEVRNLTFSDYPEDACAFDGANNSEAANYGNYWIHNNVFNVGKRLFDDTAEHDKAEGDGAIDIKFCHNATYSYNKVVNCHKTGLVGGSDSNLQWNITFHHNYFLKCESRMPLGRQANMHYYNNYYEGITSYCMSLRSNAFVFSEANYYLNCKKTVEVKSGGVCKSYHDVFSGCTKDAATVVTDRTKTVANNCAYGDTFDIDASRFYYDSDKKVSKVTYLSSAEQAKTDCAALAGPAKANRLS